MTTTVLSVEASRSNNAQSPDLRLRQRDRMSPRRPYAQGLASASTSADPSTGKRTAAQSSGLKTQRDRTREYLKKRQAQEDINKRGNEESQLDGEAANAKFTIAPDGSSGGREGRQFTVAKVGNNGKIFLRPTIRPAKERYPQPAFSFPVTPPSTAGLDSILLHTQSCNAVEDSLLTPLSLPTPPAQNEQPMRPSGDPAIRKRPMRSYSHSTIDENTTSTAYADSGAFKIIIDRPGHGANDTTGAYGIPMLEVPIPSYKLGTPRFSMRGTAFMRNSTYTLTEDVRSSIVSGNNTPRHENGSRRPTRILSRRHSDVTPQGTPSGQPSPCLYDVDSLPASKAPRKRSRFAPQMFDSLTFKPSCDHPSLVRYSTSGAIRAATPARLVAEITSPTFVDYDLLSDFFLTFRTFLETIDLLDMLIARLKWALLRNDEAGTIVRVRTFVAIRHWILNYFLDDFVVDYELRQAFCDSVNNFVKAAHVDEVQTKIPLKILEELKKCWRRVCALYWDGPEFDSELNKEVEIVPGGVAGSRNPNLNPTFWQDPDQLPPRLDGIVMPDFVESEQQATSRDRVNYFADVSRAGHLHEPTNRPIVARQGIAHIDPPLSPTSVMSEHVISCSFPFRGRNQHEPTTLRAHPVEATETEANTSALPKAALPNARTRPSHAHKRSGSFSDSIRDHRQQTQPIQKVIYKSTEILLALPYAGSLVRGNLFPPGQAFVDDILPITPSDTNQSSAPFSGSVASNKNPSAMSGPGMKKLLGSVRRVLSTKNSPQVNSSPTLGSFPHIPPLGIRGATINRLPGTAVVPQATSGNVGSRVPTRIDLLGAEIAEDFKRAVQEDAEAEEAILSVQKFPKNRQNDKSSACPDDTSLLPPDATVGPFMYAPERKDVMSGVTTGSKSIVIVDDTMSLDMPVMRGALPLQGSEDSLDGAYIMPSGDPTPPSTPPEVATGLPRRSSHLLGHSNQRRSQSMEETPSLVVDSRPSVDDEPTPERHYMNRRSIYSGQGHHKFDKSLSLRRFASFQSGIARDQSELSFDATTLSDNNGCRSPTDEQPLPLPLRVLRRRPGGDLRAFNNATDLEPRVLRRPQSTGSLATFTDSVRSSLLYTPSAHHAISVNAQPDSEHASARFSLGALAEAPKKRPVSLFSTHSSQPVMRPSFEKEARFLAQIPDDVDDDGGVESALLKLEGKYEKRNSDISQPQDHVLDADLDRQANSFGVAPHEMSTLTLADDEDQYDVHRLRHEHEIGGATDLKPLPIAISYRPQPRDSIELRPTVYQPRGMLQQINHVSAASYSSIPLLDRGLTDDEYDPATQDWSDHSILRAPSNDRQNTGRLTMETSHPNSLIVSSDVNVVDDSHIEDAGIVSVHKSFLDDASEISDLSSDLSVENPTGPERIVQDISIRDNLPGLGAVSQVKELLTSNETILQVQNSPVTSEARTKLLSEDLFYGRPAYGDSFEQRLPPSPEATPTADEPYLGRVVSPTFDPLRSNGINEPSRKTSVHLPFVVAFDSQVLAQQFTLIEKDALNEIDWKDLIEMRWKDRANTESRSWVDFLRNAEPHGVEVVIARFNIMVKWAVSELVLTHDKNERVRCIIKYIHIAQQCRRYRNFATMTQLTVALTSKEIARLTNTWLDVPAGDLNILRDLEILISPTGNFHNLRAEMEGGGTEQGCIPFVGIYTHDLLINQERPNQIASTPVTDPLVNFDRCRMDAAIVKNLLRLLEASQMYRFQPIEGITERCLWMAALSDNDIHQRGLAIQSF